MSASAQSKMPRTVSAQIAYREKVAISVFDLVYGGTFQTAFQRAILIGSGNLVRIQLLNFPVIVETLKDFMKIACSP
jgi:hypothetical protein